MRRGRGWRRRPAPPGGTWFLQVGTKVTEAPLKIALEKSGCLRDTVSQARYIFRHERQQIESPVDRNQANRPLERRVYRIERKAIEKPLTLARGFELRRGSSDRER
jgi:hypothetical protein